MDSCPFAAKEASLLAHLKVTRAEDIGRRLVEVAQEKCQGLQESKRKSSALGAPTGVHVSTDDQKAIDYISQSLEAVSLDLSPTEVSAAIMSNLSVEAVASMGSFLNQVYTNVDADKKVSASSYQMLLKITGTLFGVFNTDWVKRGISTTWSFVTNSLSKIFKGAERVFAAIDKTFNVTALIKLAFERIFGLLRTIAATVANGFRLIYDQAAGIIEHVYSIGNHILDRVTDGDNALKTIYESSRIITDRLGFVSMVLHVRELDGSEDLSTLDTAIESVSPYMSECFGQLTKLLPTAVRICDGYSSDTIDASPEEKAEKESVVRNFVKWISFNPLFKAVMEYASSTAATVEAGWKTFASKFAGALQKITSVLSASLYLALFAFRAIIGNQAAITFLSHMGLTSSKTSSSVSTRRVLTAVGIPYNEDSLKIEEESVDQVLNSVSDAENAPNGDEMIDLIVSSQSSFTYPSLVKTAQEMVRVFRHEMPDETASSILKHADRLEKTLDTRNLTQRYAGLFKGSNNQSRKAMRRLLDAISYSHSNTDSDFRAALADLEVKENREAKSALRELKGILMEKDEEIKRSALDLLRVMNTFQRVPRNEEDESRQRSKKKKRSNKYEDARQTFDSKLRGTVDQEGDDPVEEPDPATQENFLSMVVLKIREYIVATILAIRNTPLRHLVAIILGFAVSYLTGPNNAMTYAAVLGNPFHFLAGQLVKSWVTPHVTSLMFASEPLETTSEELTQAREIVENSVQETLSSFRGTVNNVCFTRTTEYLGFKNSITPSSAISTAGTCVVRPVEQLTSRLTALKDIARSLEMNGPTDSIRSASAKFLKAVGSLDVDQTVDIAESTRAYKELASEFVATEGKNMPDVTSFFTRFDDAVESINKQTHSYVDSLIAFFGEKVDYRYYQEASRHLRMNARDEYVNASRRASRRLTGEDPVGLSTDREDLPEELRAQQTLLETPYEEFTFLNRVRASPAYEKFYPAFSSIQDVCHLSSIYMMLYDSAITTLSVLLVHLAFSKLQKLIFKDSGRQSTADIMSKYRILNKLSSCGGEYVAKALYAIGRLMKYTISIFLVTTWSTFLASMFQANTETIISGTFLKGMLVSTLVCMSTAAIAASGKAIGKQLIKLSGCLRPPKKTKTH